MTSRLSAELCVYGDAGTKGKKETGLLLFLPFPFFGFSFTSCTMLLRSETRGS